ncbi:MAG: 6-carboxytetrahydropterin synthase [Prevotellaceae bacterium]|jgi:6-pyruvoyltetrahydropterin/6-carboxytetrahydropterin synthase|nr:6-carboxytetrahydropterin synthase [Prevotellaceae bacterium]
MAKIRVTKEFRFEMAHALEDYNGKCRHLHGHSYILYVTVLGEPNNNANDSTYGMVIDFGELKQLVNKHIVNKFDHVLVLRKDAKLADALQKEYGNIMLTDYHPTCENMVVAFAETLKKYLPSHVQLFSLRLHETATSYAEWYAKDN